jgi:DNA-binding transcriptional LysR family regulator
MRGGLTSCSQSARSEPRKGVWCGVSRWSGPRPTRSILFPGGALPLALYRERSVSRKAALAALNDNELTWEIIYTSPSLTGVRAAALAGLAITPLPASALIAGLRILGVEEGLPRLPDLEFAIYEKARPDKAAAALATVLPTHCTGTITPRRSEMNRHFNRRESAVGQKRR